MRQVVRIRPAGRGGARRAVWLDDGRRLVLDAEDVSRLGLEPGQGVDDLLLRRLDRLAREGDARAAALRLLNVRLRSRAELEHRLARRGFDPKTVARVLDRLAIEGWVDDRRFVRAWVEGRLALGRAGPRRLRAELRSRGVPADLVDEVLRAAWQPEEERTRAEALARRHLARTAALPPQVRLRRVAGLLARRGFSPEVVADLVRRLAREVAPTVTGREVP
jgi:regulatory protein